MWDGLRSIDVEPFSQPLYYALQWNPDGWTTFDLTFDGLARSSQKGDHEGIQFVTQLSNHQDVTVRINTGIGTRCSGLRLDHGAPVWQSQFSHLHSQLRLPSALDWCCNWMQLQLTI